MATSFACPECGQGIKLRGLTPGREVVCPACATRVEVPFLPRVARPRERPTGRVDRPPPRSRGRRRSAAGRRRRRWGLALGAVALIALGTTWAVRRIERSTEQGHERILRELLAASDRAALAHDAGGAFREVDAALILARKIDPTGSSRLAILTDRRDRAARAEVAARLAALATLPPEQAVGEAAILAERARRDPALRDLANAVAAGVESATLREVETNRDQARAALQAGQGGEAFRRANRAYERADRLSDPAQTRQIRAEARELVVAAVVRYGVILKPDPPAAAQPGEPASTPTDDLTGPLWVEALTSHGYLLEPDRSDWGEVWERYAPYRAGGSVAESNRDLYQQSQNRATQIDARFILLCRGRTCWENRVFAQTRSPMLDLPAFLAGKLATASRRDPEIERRLRDDARAAFRSQATRVLRGIPPPEFVAAPTATSIEPREPTTGGKGAS